MVYKARCGCEFIILGNPNLESLTDTEAEHYPVMIVYDCDSKVQFQYAPGRILPENLRTAKPLPIEKLEMRAKEIQRLLEQGERFETLLKLLEVKR